MKQKRWTETVEGRTMFFAKDGEITSVSLESHEAAEKYIKMVTHQFEGIKRQDFIEAWADMAELYNSRLHKSDVIDFDIDAFQMAITKAAGFWGDKEGSRDVAHQPPERPAKHPVKLSEAIDPRDMINEFSKGGNPFSPNEKAKKKKETSLVAYQRDIIKDLRVTFKNMTWAFIGSMVANIILIYTVIRLINK